MTDPMKFLEQYGYQAPPDQAMIEALMAQQGLGNQAQQAQPRLAKQMTQAEALRDKPTPRSTSWLSGLAGLGNKVSGIRDVQDTRKQQVAGEQALGGSLAALQQAQMQRQSRTDNNALAGTRMAMANREQDQQIDAQKAQALALHREQDQQIDTQKAQALALHQSAERQNRLDVAGQGKRTGTRFAKPPSAMIDLESGDNRNVYFHNGQYYDKDTKEPIDPTKLKAYGDLGLGTGKERDTLINSPQTIQNATKFDEMSDEQWGMVSQPLSELIEAGVPTKLLNTAIVGGENQGLIDWVEKAGLFNSKFSGEDRQNIKNSLGTYNELFATVVNPYMEQINSGPLSDGDVKRLLGSINIQRGQSGDVMGKSVRILTGRVLGKMGNLAAGYLQEGDRTAHQIARKTQDALDVGTDARRRRAMMDRAPDGVTMVAVKSWLGDLRNASPQELEDARAIVQANPGKDPALTFALQEMERMAGGMK